MSERERAVELFKEGFNCSQSVFTAFAHRFNIDEKTAKKISAGLGGGVGRLREVCGAVSGAAMVIGSLTAATEGHDAEGKQKNYELVQEFARRFIDENGSVICHELLGLGKESEKSPKPDSRTAEYYKKRPCVELVECAAAILEDIIKENE